MPSSTAPARPPAATPGTCIRARSAQFGGSVNFGYDYDDVDDARQVSPEGKTGWIGFTDIYWLSALIPQDGAATTSDFRALGNADYRADLIYDPVTVAPGRQATRTTRLFAGAKESDVLDAYEEQGVGNFGLAIDWGWFRWFEKPIFWLLKELFHLVGNFGVAIMLLTVIIRGLMFPVAQKGFASMAQMRAVQPKMKALQERYKDDKAKLQEEMSKLYKEEKVNPLAGCLPMFLQIPMFFALYKTLLCRSRCATSPSCCGSRTCRRPIRRISSTCSACSTSRLPGFLAIGLLALLLGTTMWLTFRLNPAAMDPMQQQIFIDHAVGDDVRHGAVRGRSAALLDHLQPAHGGAAAVPLFEAPAIEGAGQEGPGGQGRASERGKLEG